MVKHSLAAVAVLACLAPTRADADPAKAWAAAKTHLSGAPVIVGGVNITELGKSSIVKMALPLAAPDVKKALDQLQRVCGIDAWKTVEAIAWGTDKDFDEGVLFVAVKGIDQAKVSACVEGIVKDDGDAAATVSVTSDGAITALSTGKHTYHLMWIGKDVVALSLDPSDKAQLARWTPKKGALARSKLGKLAAKTNTRATVWAATTDVNDYDGAKISATYGSLSLRGGNVAVDIHAAFDDAAKAKEAADKLGAQLAGSADLKSIADRISIKPAASELVVKANVTESEVMQAAGSLRP
ncbi:MAG TPA: hypothetical protein VM513_30755 [Kofleriaceae bacterium]|nr:hypothetical protein [Kofleriaceae bacterium]